MSTTVSKELLALDITGKTIVVTGGNSGIGLITCQQLAKQGATVVLCCRRVSAGEEAKAKMQGTVDVMQLDLADLTSVKSFAEKFNEKYDKCDVLVNNGALAMCLNPMCWPISIPPH